MECHCPSYINVFIGLLVGLLGCVFILVYRYRKHSSKKSQEQLNSSYINSFEPAPLIDDDSNIESVGALNIVTGKVGKHIVINGQRCLNLGTNNFFNLVGNENIEKLSIEAIQTYGVGSCGPRGFYGTVDVHLELEERIARFMQKEEAVVYSYGFSTVASAIPAYAKRTDVLFVDEKISFAAQQGIEASKAKVYYFKHNDPKDLEDKIIEYNNQFARAQTKAKKFLVLEGIYHNTGTICNLPAIIPLRSKYKMRLFIDESYSIGVLGKTGRGVGEYFNVDPTEIDMSIGTLENLIGSVGGFCVGSHFIIEHQRLSGLGYCFSASLPPVLTRAAICAFDYMESKLPQIFSDFQQISLQLHDILDDLKYFKCISSPCSPIKYLKPADDRIDHVELEKFVNECKNSELLVTLIPNFQKGKPVRHDYFIKFSVNLDLTNEDFEFISKTLRNVEEKLFC